MKFTDIFSDNNACCIFCNRRKNLSKFVFNHAKVGVCDLCNSSLPLFSTGMHDTLNYHNVTVSAPFAYSGKFRDAFLRYKFRGCRSYAPIFAFYMNAMLEYMDSSCDGELISEIDFVATIPISEQRLRERTYNQSELLTKEIGMHFGIEYSQNALIRKLHTQRQSSLDSIHRTQNIKGAFSADPDVVKGKNILLIDDICTTGSTLSEAVQTLNRAGAGRIYTYVLAFDSIIARSPELAALLG